MNQPLRIIFVEGLPFTGKSTTSEYITAQLRLNGYAAQWVAEGVLFRQYFPQTLSMLDQEQPFSVPVWHAEWASFLETALALDSVLVVDSALSYVGVSPLLNENRPRTEIDAAIAEIAKLCAPLAPRVIHLMGDMARLVPASIVDRGAAWEDQLIRQSDSTPYQQARGRTGLEGAIMMFRETQELTAEVLVQDAWSVLTLDVMSPDWDVRRRAILNFLGLEEIAIERPDVPQAMLESYIGTYTPEDPARVERVLSVQNEGGTLILYGPRERYGPLVPISLTRFHLQATPIDIEFSAEDGQSSSLTLFRSDGTSETCRRTA